MNFGCPIRNPQQGNASRSDRSGVQASDLHDSFPGAGLGKFFGVSCDWSRDTLYRKKIIGFIAPQAASARSGVERLPSEGRLFYRNHEAQPGAGEGPRAGPCVLAGGGMASTPVLSVKDRIEALKRTPEQDRGNAAYSLEHEPDLKALPILLGALKDPDPYIRESVIHSLDYYDKEPMEAELASVLARDADARVREAAAGALYACSTNAISALINALNDPAARVREQAALSLGRLGATEAIAPLAALLAADDNVKVRIQAASALGEMRDEAVLAHLIAHINDQQAPVRRKVADALGEAGHEQALAPLASMLKDADAEVRERAAWALASATAFGEVDGSNIVPCLLDALDDQNVTTRCHAMRALGNIQGRDALPPLLTRLKDENGEIRAAAVQAVASIDKMGSIRHLVSALRDSDADVRRSAARTLEFIEPDERLSAAIKREIFDIVSDSKTDFVVRCSLLEGMAGDPDAAPVLIGNLLDESKWVREAAAKALGARPDDRALKPLIAALNDAEDCVRAQAALALAAFALADPGDGAAVEPLSALLKADDSPSVRRRVVWALSFFTHPTVPDLLTGSLQDADPYVRETAAEALIGLENGEPRSIHLGAVHYE